MKKPNTRVLGDGSKAPDHSHVSTSSPIQLKKRELAETPRTAREKAVSEARRNGKVRPL